MTQLLDAFYRRVGRYAGHGIQGDDTPFHGELEVAPLLKGNPAMSLKFSATGIDGTRLHEERSWVSTDSSGELCLWSVTTDGGQVTRHACKGVSQPPESEARAVFVHVGSDGFTVRSRVTIDLMRDGRWGYAREHRGHDGLLAVHFQVAMAISAPNA